MAGWWPTTAAGARGVANIGTFASATRPKEWGYPPELSCGGRQREPAHRRKEIHVGPWVRNKECRFGKPYFLEPRPLLCAGVAVIKTGVKK